MKEDNEVITEFNEYVNVSASELDKWLKSDDSSKAGWHKDGGDGESVGQESGHKIVEILKSNPSKDPEKYTDDQIQHMRKVASYCKRHLAQEAKGLKDKGPEEAKKTKSYISLMNWGHDPLKAAGKGGSTSGSRGSRSKSKKQESEKDEEDEEQEEENGDEAEQDEKEEGDDKKAGDKRKSSGQQSGASKKRETRQGKSSKKDEGGDGEDEDDGDDGDDQQEEAEDDADYEEDDDNDASGDKSSGNGPKKGDTVSWKWGSGHPHGKVLDVKEEEYVSNLVIHNIFTASILTIQQCYHHNKARK